MSLQNEIDLKSKEIHSDSYAMSIGEIASLYKENELDIHPDFQRIYRWSEVQKTRLIESILLGIPIPSIFVAQRADGVWDVIDGLQRLSTIFEFMGILKNEKGIVKPPLKLLKTAYLPSLNDILWETKENDEKSLDQTQRLIIKRSKVDVQIVKRESDKEAKYELFQRLNTGGSKLSEQEVRNCLLVMMDKERYNWIKELSNNTDFKECITITERGLNQAFDNELVIRYMIYRNTPPEDISRSTDLSDLITKQMISFIEDPDFDFEDEKQSFIKTFKLLRNALNEDTFRKYSKEKSRFQGPFSISAFEAIIPGLSKNIDQYSEDDTELIISIIKELWDDPDFKEHSGAGLRAADRVKYLFPISTKIFTK